MNILFLAAATGGGHVRAAEALKEYMEKQVPGCRINIIDALKYINPLVDKLIAGTYLRTIKSAPAIYGKLYDLSEKDELMAGIARKFNGLLANSLCRLFRQESPDTVVCTHTMPLQMVSHLKKQGLLDIPAVGIVTDYTNHNFWKLDGVDAYIVAHDCIKEDMIRSGMPGEIIHACGIPVSGRFTEELPKRNFLLEKYGLDNRPTILVMGGSLGFDGMQDIYSSLLALRRDIQIIAVAGHNKKLKSQLEILSGKSEKKTIVFGYTDNVSELMGASDIIITKPGGITVSEALARRLPLIIVTPIPGQEERNARFLANSDAAWRMSLYDDMESILEKTLDRPSVLHKMAEAAGKLAKPRACEEITMLVKKLSSIRSEALCVSR